LGPIFDADDPARRSAPQPIQRRLLPTIVEAQPVDHRPVLLEPEQPGLRIARLRQGRQRADLGKAEPRPSIRS
jgi:hypothetical protein